MPQPGKAPAEGPARRATMLRFLGLFGLGMVVGVVLLDVGVVKTQLVDPWTRFNATASAGLASLVGIETEATGTLVRSGNARLNILEGCNGVHAMLILLSAILAFPAAWPRRILGALAGAAVVFGFNLIRLVNLIAVARWWPEQLDLFHLYIWQTLIVLIAVALFLVWGTYFSQPREAPAAA